jgi:hypothetical protein
VGDGGIEVGSLTDSGIAVLMDNAALSCESALEIKGATVGTGVEVGLGVAVEHPMTSNANKARVSFENLIAVSVEKRELKELRELKEPTGVL